MEVGEGVCEVGSWPWTVSIAVMAAWNLGSWEREGSLEEAMSPGWWLYEVGSH